MYSEEGYTGMCIHRYEQRREKLRSVMRERGISLLFVSNPADRYYLSGFEFCDIHARSSGGYLLITGSGNDILFTDSRFLFAAEQIWDPSAIVLCTHGKEIASYIKQAFPSVVLGVDVTSLNADMYIALQKECSLCSVDNIVASLRMIKEEYELACIKKSVALNYTLMEHIQKVLHEGISEWDVANNIESFFKEHGAFTTAFPSIVAFGVNGALPHYAPHEKPLILSENMPVLIDCGAVVEGYCSDQTRTFWYGSTPSKEFLTAYEHVEKAQRHAMEGIRPGVSVESVYMRAWNYFDSVGVAQHFVHALGHGIGLCVHEKPSISRNSTLLQENMVITIEPGLYYPKWGGVRIEHMVQVTQDGYIVL